MNYFLSYVLILAGALAFTTGALGRFIHRGKLKFELDDLGRLLLILLSFVLLAGGMILYSYQAEINGVWSTPPVFPTPTP